MCTASRAPSYSPPAAPAAPSISEVANSQFGNALTPFLNPDGGGGFGLTALQRSRSAGLSDFQIRNLLSTSGATTVGEKAAQQLGISAGPVLNPTQQLEAQYAQQRAQEYAVAEQRFQQQASMQQAQFEQSMRAQENALQAQLAQQNALAKSSEEAALRAQVPQMTANSANATRVRATSASRKAARAAAQGTSQLRVPLGINSSGTGSMTGLVNTSPVKLNIG